MTKYDAFISYSHREDKRLAQELQHVIQTLGKPWYRLREARVFRDFSSMTADEDIWDTVVTGLENSKYFILLANPTAGASEWVNREVEWWLENRGPETLLVGLTRGELAWDREAGDFIWHDDMPVPQALDGAFENEPFWVDLSPWQKSTFSTDERDEFKSFACKIAGTVRGVPPEDLWSDELKAQTRNWRWAKGAIAGLAVLTGSSFYGYLQANENASKSEFNLALRYAASGDQTNALKTALKGYNSGVKGRRRKAELESSLYNVVSYATPGLIAAAEIHTTKPTQTSPKITAIFFAKDNQELCVSWERNDFYEDSKDLEEAERTSLPGHITQEPCFSFSSGTLKFKQYRVKSPVHEHYQQLAVTRDETKITFRRETNKPPYDQNAVAYRTGDNTLLSLELTGDSTAWHCDGKPYIAVSRSPPNLESTERWVIINTETETATQIEGDLSSHHVFCNPFEPFVLIADSDRGLNSFDLSTPDKPKIVTSGLSIHALDRLSVSFAKDGLAFIGSLKTSDIRATSAKLIDLADTRKRVISNLPRWGAHVASFVALSTDGKLAAVMFDNNVLTVWDTSQWGLEGSQSLQSDPATKRNDDTKHKLLRNGPNDDCVAIHNGPGFQTMVRYSKSSVAWSTRPDGYVFAPGPITFLSDRLPDCAREDDGIDRNDEVRIRTLDKTSGTYALCKGSLEVSYGCEFFTTSKNMDWLRPVVKETNCVFVAQKNHLLLCRQTDPHSRPEVFNSLTAIDFKNRDFHRESNRNFGTIYDIVNDATHFNIRWADHCDRFLISIIADTDDLGVKRAKTVLFIDPASKQLVAKLSSNTTPVFCTLQSLINYITSESEKYTLRKVELPLLLDGFSTKDADRTTTKNEVENKHLE